MGEELKITYDPDADAMYVLLSQVAEVGSGPTDVDEAGVIIDTDSFGNARGFEFLSVRSLGVHMTTVPEQVARNIQRFIDDGYLNTNVPVEIDYMGP